MTRTTLAHIALGLAMMIASDAYALPAQASAGKPTASGTFAAEDASFVSSDGVRLHVDVRGKGVPTLYLHGGPGSGSHSFETAAGPAIEPEMRMIYLDQRGSGRSASPANGDYSLERIVEDAEELRHKLGIKRWVLMAYSFGGLIAQAYAEKHPERVAGMVLANGILDLQGSMALTVSAVKGYPGMPPLPDAMPLPVRYFTALGAIEKSGQSYRLNYRDAASRDAILARVKKAQDWTPNNDMAKHVLGGANPGRYLEDFTPGTAKVKVPVLLVTGSADVMAGPALYARYRYPNRTQVVLDGAHAVIMEQPDAFADAVSRYLHALPNVPAWK